MKKPFTVGILLLSILLLGACSENNDNTTETKTEDQLVDIYTTVYPLQDFAEKIGGKYVKVASVYPPGTDEHTFEPSQKDIISMAQSDLFFYIGHNLEGFVTKAKPILEKEGVTLAALGEQIDLDAETHSEEDHEKADTDDHHDEGHTHGDVDPHVWIDPNYAAEMAELITEQLVKQMPEQREYFQANAQKLTGQFAELDNQLADVLSSAKTKKIIVSHSAFGYWESRYGLEQISISGLNSASEPSQKQLEDIIKTAQKNDLHYVVFEQNFSSKLAEILQAEIDADSLTLHNLSVLSDEDIKEKKDYFSIMRQNIETLKIALNK